MKVGFDAKRAAQNRTGLGNYSRFVIRILSEHLPNLECHLYTPNPNRVPFLEEISTLKSLNLHFPHTKFWRKWSAIWRVWGVTQDIKQDGMEIYHGLSNELPLNIRRAGVKSVVTIHDVIFRHYPKYYHFIDRKIYDYKFRKACRHADKVIAVSEFTKCEIMHYYGTPAAKIDVVYQGCDKSFAAPISEEKLREMRQKYNLPKDYLLYVGSIEERKNLMLVARALSLMEQKPMVIAVGKRTSYVARIKDYLDKERLTSHFRFFHTIPFTDLPSLYRMATVFVYPSRIEGFGIPMLEALTSGVPAIGCTGSCLEEAGGSDSIYVDPDDADTMAKVIGRVMEDEALRSVMIVKGKEYAKRFSDERLCADLVEVYESLFVGKSVE